jgi:hypothetical protein
MRAAHKPIIKFSQLTFQCGHYANPPLAKRAGPLVDGAFLEKLFQSGDVPEDAGVEVTMDKNVHLVGAAEVTELLEADGAREVSTTVPSEPEAEELLEGDEDDEDDTPWGLSLK